MPLLYLAHPYSEAFHLLDDLIELHASERFRFSLLVRTRADRVEAVERGLAHYATFASASMRCIVIEFASRGHSGRRAGGFTPIALDETADI